MTPFNSSKDFVEVTNIESANNYKQYKPTFRDSGVLSLSLFFSYEAMLLFTEEFNLDTMEYYRVVFPDTLGTSFVFLAGVASLPVRVSSGQAVTMDVNLRTSGEVKLYESPPAAPPKDSVSLSVIKVWNSTDDVSKKPFVQISLGKNLTWTASDFVVKKGGVPVAISSLDGVYNSLQLSFVGALEVGSDYTVNFSPTAIVAELPNPVAFSVVPKRYIISNIIPISFDEGLAIDVFNEDEGNYPYPDSDMEDLVNAQIEVTEVGVGTIAVTSTSYIGNARYWLGLASKMNPGAHTISIPQTTVDGLVMYADPAEFEVAGLNTLTLQFTTGAGASKPQTLAGWNAFFDLPNWGTPFTALEIVSADVFVLTSSVPDIVLNADVLANYDLLKVEDTGCVISVGTGALRNNAALTTAYLPATPSIGWYTFENNVALVDIHLDSCDSVGPSTADNFNFKGITGNVISLRIPAASRTDGDVVFLEANNTVTVTET
jgi:hypothetical protein